MPTGGRTGVGVSVVCPGVIDTPIAANTRYRGAMDASEGPRVNARSVWGTRRTSSAKAIVDCVKRNRDVVPVGIESTLAYKLLRGAPQPIQGLVARATAVSGRAPPRRRRSAPASPGVGLGVRLLQAGIDDFVILERNESVGGTWFEHTYPGCGCDIPTHLYSYAFARNPNWTRLFPQQDEILDYVRGIARRVRGHAAHPLRHRDGAQSTGTRARALWHVRTPTASELTCDVLVSAIGATAEPDEPDIPGLDEVQGAPLPLRALGPRSRPRRRACRGHRHRARQRRSSSRASSRRSGSLTVFQRTPPWVMPHVDRPVSWVERQLYKACPAAAGRPAQRAVRGL